MAKKIITLVIMIIVLVLGAAYPAGEATMKLTSPAFENGHPIPPVFTADGKDVSPPLVISGVPEGAKSLALIMDDPDAPMGTWVHWVVWNIPPDVEKIEEGKLPAGAKVGKNSWGRNEYGGPAPPYGTHRYFFKLYALDTELDLPSSTTAQKLEAVIKGHVLAKAELMGTYTRRR